jgi:hypothetical protein
LIPSTAAGSIAAGIQAGIGNVAAGSAFAVLQSAGTMPLITGAIGAATGAAAGAGGGAIWAAKKHPPKASGTDMNTAGGATQTPGSVMKATGESATQTFMNTAPLVKSAIGGAIVATGDSMAIARDSTAKAFTNAMPVVNGVLNDVAKGAGGAAANVQENVSKTFEVAKPWVAGAVGNAMRATGGGAAVVGRKGEDLLKAVRKIPFRSVFRGRL